MSEWLPIETAPRDGTWVLGYAPSDYDYANTGPIVVMTWGCYSYNEPDSWVFGPDGTGHAVKFPVPAAPLYWMPLPPPPDTNLHMPRQVGPI